jgi:predicted TIM-barrel fold metal-dependent hydrolase
MGSPAPPVFDGHAHLAPRPGAAAALLATMDASGIARAIVLAGGTLSPDLLSRQIAEGGGVDVDADNDAVLRACAEADGRLVPFYFANPHRPCERYREAAPRFRGLKLAPGVHGVALDDPRTVALAGAAAELGQPVYAHCLARPGFDVPAFVELAARFPDGRFILGHAGVGTLDLRAVDLVQPCPKVWFETSGGYTFVIRAAIERLGSDRVLFGSEYPLEHPRVELEKLRVLELAAATWHDVCWANACRLIGEAVA